jgi:HAD superfamily phosphoserine phosphatase-like hydrolase
MEGWMKIVYVDFDGTLVRSNSFHYLYYCLRQKLTESRSSSALFWYLVCWLGLPFFILLHKCSDALRDRVTYWFYRGMQRAEIRSYAGKYFREHQAIAYKNTVHYLKVKKLEGYAIVIVSGSIQEIVSEAAKELGLAAVIDHYLAARLEYEDEIATGLICGEPMVRAEKVQAIRCFEQNLNVSERICISDSLSDLPMLELTQTAIVVNPNSKLKRHAERRRWLVWEA